MRFRGGCLRWLLALVLILGLGAAAIWWWRGSLAIAGINTRLPWTSATAALTVERVHAIASADPERFDLTIPESLLRQILEKTSSGSRRIAELGLFAPGTAADARFLGMPLRARIVPEGPGAMALRGRIAVPDPHALMRIGLPLAISPPEAPLHVQVRIDSLRLVDEGPAQWRLIVGGLAGLSDGIAVKVLRGDATLVYTWIKVDGGWSPKTVFRIQNLRLGAPGLGWLREQLESDAQRELDKATARLVLPQPGPAHIPVDLRMGPRLHPDDPE